MTPDVDDMFVNHRKFWMIVREALLSINNEIELNLGVFPTTSAIRGEYKAQKASQKQPADLSVDPVPPKPA